MCAVNRVLMKQQAQQKKKPEIEGLPSEGDQEERLGAEPTSETQVFFLLPCVHALTRLRFSPLRKTFVVSCQSIGIYMTLLVKWFIIKAHCGIQHCVIWV
jgi:hypothetical protein